MCDLAIVVSLWSNTRNTEESHRRFCSPQQLSVFQGSTPQVLCTICPGSCMLPVWDKGKAWNESKWWSSSCCRYDWPVMASCVDAIYSRSTYLSGHVKRHNTSVRSVKIWWVQVIETLLPSCIPEVHSNRSACIVTKDKSKHLSLPHKYLITRISHRLDA